MRLSDKVKVVVAIVLFFVTLIFFLPNMFQPNEADPMDIFFDYLETEKDMDASSNLFHEVVSDNRYSFDRPYQEYNYGLVNTTGSVYRTEHPLEYEGSLVVLEITFEMTEKPLNYLDDNEFFLLNMYEELAIDVYSDIRPHFEDSNYRVDIRFHGRSNGESMILTYSFHRWDITQHFVVEVTDTSSALDLSLYEHGEFYNELLQYNFGETSTLIANSSDESMIIHYQMNTDEGAVYFHLRDTDNVLVERYLTDTLSFPVTFYDMEE
jgi:hypothetical protein